MNALRRTEAQRKTRTVSSNEAKQRWGKMMNAVNDGERVVVASHGRPRVAVVSVEDLERLEALDEQERREAFIRRLEALQWRQAERNKDLTDEEIEELATRATRAAIDELAAEGKLVFERDHR
jgi:prevent-host-death family protein